MISKNTFAPNQLITRPPFRVARMTKGGRFGPFRNDRPATLHGWYTRNAIYTRIVYDANFLFFACVGQFKLRDLNYEIKLRDLN